MTIKKVFDNTDTGIVMLQRELESRDARKTEIKKLVDRYQHEVDRINMEIKLKKDEDSEQK